MRPCLGLPGIRCLRVTSGTRCPEHARMLDRARGTRQQRGYGAEHQQARARLVAYLPLPCAYCGMTLYDASELVAAHVVDGDPTAGWQPSCRTCNERAKRRAGGL